MPEVSVAKLSPTQLRKMKNGKPFRITVAYGTNGTNIHLNDLQYKGFIRNSKNGKSYTIIYEPPVQGAGIVGDLAGFVHPAAGLLAKAVGLGMKKKATKRGKGIIGDLATMYNPSLGMVAKAVGLGMKKPRKTRGKGFLGDLAKTALNVGKSLITPDAIKGVLNTGKDYLIQEGTNYVGNKASDYLKDKIGFGMLRKASPKQLASLARARAMRKIKPKTTKPKWTKPKKTGSGRKKIYGSALRVAGAGYI